ncbi:30S ribosomal protein S4 [Candidatus Peregrinibacteria bacterium]|nr:30S ribosomal protein S4 [Candidatus Peregrinibacteria bacterium]
MGRYIGPMCRLCRREGMKLCDKHKCASIKRPYPPGMHGKDQRAKKSDYAKQLREKQKTRRIFGVSEKQIRKYYRVALAAPVASGEELIRQLESRLDNIVFRIGLASTRRQARQMVSHGMFNLNGRRIKVPSVQLETGDKFEVRQKSKTSALFADMSKKKINPPSWLKLDTAALTGEVIGKAAKGDLEASIEPQMIIEFYSR